MSDGSSSQSLPASHLAAGRHAVVIGGSIGGMLAARVLSEHFDAVTVVERDRLPEGSEFRILYRSGWSPRGELGLEFCTFTRPLLEATIRRHLKTDPKITLIDG